MDRELKYTSFISIVLILICLNFPQSFSDQLKCERRINCDEVQIGSKADCCYLSPGDQCGDDTKRICDTDMGYSCDKGLCSGKYNLTVEWIDTTSMNITWSPFLPEGAQYNYTVLYSKIFHNDPLLYNSHSVGNRNRSALKWLTPNTWYFVQVGIWTGKSYEILTEVAMWQTKATDHCLYNGRRVTIGEQLVIECEESCYCTSTGRFHCVPVCTKQQPDTPSCLVTTTREECCDIVHHCSYDACSYLGETVQHDYSWVINCDENCTCYDGSVTCVPHCSDVMIPDNCTSPVLTKSRDSCCETYECHKIEYACQYQNTSYEVDTWFQSTDCEICNCMESGELSCIDFSKCATTILPNESEICHAPGKVDNHCCSQIICEKQTVDNDIFSLFTITKHSLSSVLVRFQFTSTKDEIDAVQLKLFYTDELGHRNFTHWTSNISINFKDIIDTSNKPLELRDFGKPLVLYRLNRNYVLVIPKLNPNTFYYIKLKVEFDQNLKAIHEYTSATRAIRLPGVYISEANHLKSMLNRVIITVVNISSNSAFVSWNIPESLLLNMSSFVFKYKAFRSAEWQYTERLIFSKRDFLLSCLYPSSWYEAQLIAHPGGHRLATTFFNTSSIIENSSLQITVNIRNISVRTSSAIIAWEQLPESLATNVNNIQVLWTRGNDYETVLIACVTKHQNSYILQDLASDSMYTVWLGISRKDGTTAFTNRMHFVSLQQYNLSHSENHYSIYFAVTGIGLSLVAMAIAIATVVYLLKYKRRASYQEHMSFENRIFQIYNNKDDRDTL